MPWNLSNPLYRWMQKNRKLNKSVKPQVTQRKTKLAKKRRRPRFSRLKRYFTRRKDRRISILGAAALGAAEFQAVAPSWQFFSAGDVQNGVKSLAHEHLYVWTGYASPLWGGEGGFHPERLAQTWGPIIVAGLASKYLGKYVNPTFRNIPLIGSKLKL